MNKNLTRREWFADYEDFREAYRYKRLEDDEVHNLLNWCDRNYPDDAHLTQEMLDVWGKRHENETEWAYGHRASTVNGFLRHVNSHGGGPYKLFDYNWSKGGVEPALFSRKEMMNFFRAVDEYAPSPNCRSVKARFQSKINNIQLPVIFRMLYSTGIRVNEIRWLNREDVDLEHGTVHVRRSKGYIERMMALHPTMLALLKEYDALMRKLMPDATAFFPSDEGGFHNRMWLNKYFKIFWYKYNPRPKKGERPVVAYAFRHNYAIENIMRWDQHSGDADKRLVALSRSMGHVYIESTQYYFHLVPRFADVLEETEGEFVSRIIPEVRL
ncbi:MAG: tyrosine-type recombinase/integrase [Chordicoccus sp.]